jgi:hypothetical protein
MKMTTKQIKKRFFDKKYANAKTIKCACGCGKNLKEFDHYGRVQSYINGHNGRKYDDPTQHKREWNHRNQGARYNAKRIRARKLKAKLIWLLGGKCSHCKIVYNGTNGAIFQFHHNEPKKKCFPITQGSLGTKAWEVIINESKKCILICANCHFLYHTEEF